MTTTQAVTTGDADPNAASCDPVWSGERSQIALFLLEELLIVGARSIHRRLRQPPEPPLLWAMPCNHVSSALQNALTEHIAFIQSPTSRRVARLMGTVAHAGLLTAAVLTGQRSTPCSR